MEQYRTPENKQLERINDAYTMDILFHEFIEANFINRIFIGANGTILDFTKSYEDDDIETRFYKELIERKSISPNHKYLINDWIDEIENKYKILVESDKYQYIDTHQKLMLNSFKSINKGKNPQVFTEFLDAHFNLDYTREYFEDFKNYLNIKGDDDLYGIVEGVQDAFYLQYLQIELKKLENDGEINQVEPKATTTLQKQIQVDEPIESTAHQRFLVFHYLFKYFDITGIDKTQKARFIQFATQLQTGVSKIGDTTFYKWIDNPFKDYEPNSKVLIANLQKVRELFESIGLTAIAEQVSKDIRN